jgi:hypothetical protein
MAVQERKLRYKLAFSAVELKFLVWYKSINSYGTETTRAWVHTERISQPTVLIIIIIIIIIISIIYCHRFSFFPGTSPLEPVVNPTTQASSLSL